MVEPSKAVEVWNPESLVIYTDQRFVDHQKLIDGILTAQEKTIRAVLEAAQESIGKLEEQLDRRVKRQEELSITRELAEQLFRELRTNLDTGSSRNEALVRQLSEQVTSLTIAIASKIGLEQYQQIQVGLAEQIQALSLGLASRVTIDAFNQYVQRQEDLKRESEDRVEDSRIQGQRAIYASLVAGLGSVVAVVLFIIQHGGH